MGFKVVFLLTITVAVSMQLVHSLKCATCYDIETCKKPAQINCNPATANATRSVLDHYFSDIKYLNSDAYSCFGTTYHTNNIKSVDLRGCIMTGTVDCSSYFVDTNKLKKTCTVCQKDMCNSVATISNSFVGTLALMIFAKFFLL